MTETPENSNDTTPVPLEPRDGRRRPDKGRGKLSAKMYNSTQGCDSNADLDDAAEDYLRQSIDEVWADIAKKERTRERVARRADAALIQYLLAYSAAHPDPQSFLRSLQTAVFSQESSPREVEQTDA